MTSPANLFVAGFIGSPGMNLMTATAKEGQASIGGYAVPIPREATARITGSDVTVGVRPENWRIVSAEDGGLPVKVTVVEELGADGFLYGTSDALPTDQATPGDRRDPGRGSARPPEGRDLRRSGPAPARRPRRPSAARASTLDAVLTHRGSPAAQRRSGRPAWPMTRRG